jgi:hypothetical protein
MKKDLRRQIKQDDLVTGFDWTVAWLKSHAEEARVTAIVLVVLGAGTTGLAYFQRHRAQESEELFSQALETFRSPLASEIQEGSPSPAATVYATAKEKYTKALGAFEGLERRYGSLPAGLRARYYGALCRLELADYDGAKKILTDLTARKEGTGIEPALARLALAEVEKRQGHLDKAVEVYRQVLDDASLPLPRDFALMSLASTLEEAHRADEARASYKRLAEEFPTSVYAGEARRRAEYLGSGGQG